MLDGERKRKGDASEAHVLMTLVDAGIRVLVPWGSARYDFVIEIQGRFLRLQCKTGRLAKGVVTFPTFGVGRDGARYRYLPDEIDYYAVCWLETGAVDFVPFEEAGPSPRPHLRVDMPRPGSTGGRQTTRVRWAARYAADVVIESWLRTGGNFEPLWSRPIVESTGQWHPNRRHPACLSASTKGEFRPAAGMICSSS
jgi:hypothetical protein